MKKKNRIREWITVQIAKKPRQMVLLSIFLFNVIFVLFSSFIISSFSLQGTEEMGFLEAAFCTVTMILDAGCIQFVISDIGKAGVIAVLVCLCIIFIGLISFTGGVIGYVTNYISSFIENSNTGTRKLKISGHIVILNWNTKASEIINDLLYCKSKKKIVVLVSSKKAKIEKEIEERLSDTIQRENAALYKKICEKNIAGRFYTYWKNKMRNNITVIVREGNVFSSKQLHDISLEHARTVIILGDDINNPNKNEEIVADEIEKGNPQIVKTLMQVADITSAAYSDDNQKIIVEISDDWTSELADKIIKCKQVNGKCNIVPIRVNKILGQILSQFSIMPELNLAYEELFSNKGMTFFAVEKPYEDGEVFVSEYLRTHKHAIPLTFMTDSNEKTYAFFAAAAEKDIFRRSEVPSFKYTVRGNDKYWIEKKHVIILGHNSKCEDIMRGFEAFIKEWHYANKNDNILEIVVIDDEKDLEKMGYYKKYPFVVDTVAASIYDDKEKIRSKIDSVVSSNAEGTSILILSDDAIGNGKLDAAALASLVYVQDIINDKKADDPDFDEKSLNLIVEIIDPKHQDIVSSYGVNNVVISNRYISKIITQTGEKEALYNFYTDILTYDSDSSSGYESKEVYAKKVSRYFDKLPGECTADEFIRAVYLDSVRPDRPQKYRNPTIALGYVNPEGNIVLFGGDQSNTKVKLQSDDKLIVFSNH